MRPCGRGTSRQIYFADRALLLPLAQMQNALIDGLVTYLCFLPLLTFHEFAHAWVAWKCGDDTAYRQGRVSLNPLVHMEMIGTVALPLLGVFLGAAGSAAAGFIIGWGRPVPVNLNNLRHPRRDDTLISLAGPVMNLLLAAAVIGAARLGLIVGVPALLEICQRLAVLSLFLCFFNLLPIPPLDGSHVLKNLVNMSHETYWKFCQYGFLIVIVVIQIPGVQKAIYLATLFTFVQFSRLFGMDWHALG